MKINKRGIALIVTLMVVVVLTILSSAAISRSISERFITQRYVESTQAFWLAEAGIDCALKELIGNFEISEADLCAQCSADLGRGQYSIIKLERQVITCKVTAQGAVPLARTTPTKRIIEAIIGDIFYTNAVYSAEDIDFNGNSYSVTGNVCYADKIDHDHEHDYKHDYEHEKVSGSIIRDPSISPLEQLNFQQLSNISKSQGNFYNKERIKKVQDGKDSFPGSFWYSLGIPNIIYVEGDLEFSDNVNIGTIGGFFVVMGDVKLNGNGEIQGAIYTQGKVDINGGGGNLNVNGGVWAGEEVELSGNTHIAYNLDYMSAIKGLLDKEVKIKIISWRDTQNPYLLK